MRSNARRPWGLQGGWSGGGCTSSSVDGDRGVSAVMSACWRRRRRPSGVSLSESRLTRSRIGVGQYGPARGRRRVVGFHVPCARGFQEVGRSRTPIPIALRQAQPRGRCESAKSMSRGFGTAARLGRLETWSAEHHVIGAAQQPQHDRAAHRQFDEPTNADTRTCADGAGRRSRSGTLSGYAYASGTLRLSPGRQTAAISAIYVPCAIIGSHVSSGLRANEPWIASHAGAAARR